MKIKSELEIVEVKSVEDMVQKLKDGWTVKCAVDGGQSEDGTGIGNCRLNQDGSVSVTYQDGTWCDTIDKDCNYFDGMEVYAFKKDYKSEEVTVFETIAMALYVNDVCGKGL